MKKAKKTVSLILTAVMLISILITAPTTASAAGGVQAKIDTVRAVYPNSCKYFTRSGNQCTNASGEDCKLQNIPARGGLPSGASVSSWGCYSCYAFAEYVFAYTFGKSFRNYPTAAKPVFGDVIRVVGWYGESHYGIYLGEDANYYYVFDGNGDGKCGVQYNHALSKSEHPLQQTYHASNYSDIDGESTDSQPPTINRIYISQVNDIGFRVCFEASDNIGITSAKVATWATGDMSDLIWHNCSYNGSGTYFVDLKRSDYAPGATFYISHAYVYDAAGNSSSKEITKSYNEGYSVVNSIYYSQITRDTFRICCEVNDVSNVDSVRVATWATGNMSDIKWTDCSYNGVTTYFAELNRNDYISGAKLYISHVYIKFKSGIEQSFERSIKYEDESPVISNIQISNITENGFLISCKIEDESRIKSVQFPTWLASDPKQSDIKWHEATIEDDIAKCYIAMADHNNLVDTYFIHVYAYDSFDNLGIAMVTVDMKAVLEEQQRETTDSTITEPTQATTVMPTETSTEITEPTQPSTTKPTEPIETQPTTVKTTEPTIFTNESATQSTPTKPVVKKVTKVAFSERIITLINGRSTTLKATITPTNATNKKLKWTTSNSKVATVSQSGKITAMGKGTATIKAITLDGTQKYAICKVTVKQPVTSVKLNKKSATLKVKGNAKQKTVTLKATVNPKNANNKAVSWKSSNTKIATVNSKGKVTAKKKGTCYITATAKDGSKKSAKCKVVVK